MNEISELLAQAGIRVEVAEGRLFVKGVGPISPSLYGWLAEHRLLLISHYAPAPESAEDHVAALFRSLEYRNCFGRLHRWVEDAN